MTTATDISALIAARRARRALALDEIGGKKLLAMAGIAIPKGVLVKRVADVNDALSGLAFPVVVKVVSPDILHKSDAGGVKVNLCSLNEVQHAIEIMMDTPAIQKAKLDGFLIEEMATPGQEIVVGAVQDAQFGPMIMVGLGGIFVEVLGDVSFRICPISPLDAREMLEDLKCVAILNGARGREAVSKSAIIEVLLKIGGEDGLLMRYPDEFSEIDINPLIVSNSGAVAVDARFILTQRDDAR